MPAYTTISVDHKHSNKVAVVTMQRPQVHNAFNVELIEELSAAFTDLSQDTNLHAVVLTGASPSFSAGADISMMKDAASNGEEQNIAEARRMAKLFDLINTFPCPVVARVNGTAMGGGLGLISVCDIVIAVEQARLAFSEVKLGIAPAVISPYVLRKIGENQARVLFTTGERFNAIRGQQVGLVHLVTTPERLDATVEQTLMELLSSAPEALRVCKKLAMTVGSMPQEEAHAFTTHTIASLRGGAEGQEGLRSFLEKRKPNWTV